MVDTHTLKVRRHIALRGDFSFDAISPDGRTMYLIEYSSRDVLNYAVRTYDLRAGRLVHAPVVDPEEPDEAMKGIPVTRIADEDGRWAYTLYDNGRHSFVHALDTSRRTAVCIDLDVRRAWGARLELHGERLDVVGRAARPLASIDTGRTPSSPAARAAHRGRPHAIRGREHELAAAGRADGAAAPHCRRPAPPPGRQEGLAEPITEAWESPSDQHAPTV